MKAQRQMTREDYWPGQWICQDEFMAEMERIAATCAPGSRAARDRTMDLMIRCLRRLGYGVGLDLMLELTGIDAKKQTSPTAQAAQAVTRGSGEKQ